MIKPELFHKNEPEMLRLIALWNHAEAQPILYESIFTSNAHDLAALIGNGTTYNEWQMFLTDARVQNYIDDVIYEMCGRIITQYMSSDDKTGMADTQKLKQAIDYRDAHKQDFAQPTQYIYMHIPLSENEEAFLTEEGRTYVEE